MATMIKGLYLSMKEWGEDKGRLTGKVEFTSGLGEVTINIKPEHAAKIVEVCAEALVATTRETAALMTSQIIEQAHGAVQLEG